MGMDADSAQEIYKIAYERARAALRPSAYELIQRVCEN
jgi:hypothetical protein